MATEGLLTIWALEGGGGGIWTSRRWDGWLYGVSFVGKSDHSHLVESGSLRTDRAAYTFHELTIHESELVSLELRLRQGEQQGNSGREGPSRCRGPCNKGRGQFVYTLGNFLLNFGHEKCPRLHSPLLWNSARPYRQPAKSENRSGFIAMWERTGTNKQCFDERDKICEERAFYRYLACLVFEYFETSFMSAKKEFLARFLTE